MKKIYAIILVLVMTMGFTACGKKEQAEDISGTIVEREQILQTEEPAETAAPVVIAEPTETDKAQGEGAEELPIAVFEEPADTLDTDAPTDTPETEAVADPTEAPTTVPAENPTKEAEVSPTEVPTAQPTETPVEVPTEEAPIELPFAPIN